MQGVRDLETFNHFFLSLFPSLARSVFFQVRIYRALSRPAPTDGGGKKTVPFHRCCCSDRCVSAALKRAEQGKGERERKGGR